MNRGGWSSSQSPTAYGYDIVPEYFSLGLDLSASFHGAGGIYDEVGEVRADAPVSGDCMLFSKAADPQKARRDGPDFLHFVESQTTWDRAMAQGLADALHAAPGADQSLVVGIMGSGHIRYGRGVAHQLRDLGIESVGMLLPVGAGEDCSKLDGIADAVFAVPQLPPSAPPPPRLGVRIEQNKDGVGILNVVEGSLAEKTGLRVGDRFVSVAGAKVTRVGEVIRAVHEQPAGTWMPIRVLRDGQELELVVKFPSER